MAKNYCFFTLLLIPSVITLGLLSFSISVDWWIDIKQTDLKNYQEKTQSDFDNYQKLILDQGQKNVDYFYIEKLWPLVKRFGLYSKCVEYNKFHLKISNDFLTKYKVPLIKSSIINYPKYILYNKNVSKPCESPNQVRCYYNGECIKGKRCDSVVDCNDQSDEQFCEKEECQTYDDDVKFYCDNKCWKSSQVCKQEPLCLSRSDEDGLCELKIPLNKQELENENNNNNNNNNSKTTSVLIHGEPFKLGIDAFNRKINCYQEFFDFKSAKTFDINEIDYLTSILKDNIQAEYNLVYHLHLIYVLAFVSATIFALLSVLTLLFLLCLSKLCLQCPFWFYGFFSILTLLSSCSGIAVFLYDFYMNNIYRVQDPLKQLPLKSEIYRLNDQLRFLQMFGISFWTAVAATSCSFLSSLLSFIVCCRLPSIRHDNKEYEIIDLHR